MKAITAYYLCRKHRFVHPKMTFSSFKFAKRLIWGKQMKWEEFVRAVMLGIYLDPKRRSLDEAIVVPEVKMSIGGTFHYRVELVREEGT